MKIDNIRGYNNPNFKAIILGKGGSQRLAETMPINGAKKLIRNNTFIKNDILITRDSVEILPEDKNLILKVSDKIAGSKDFTDIEVFEHGDRYVFKVEPGLSEGEIDKYGHKNRQISLAEAVAKNLKWEWLESVRMSGINNAEKDAMTTVQKSAKEIEFFNNNYYSFE